jgi:hypothetical protein
MAYGRAALLRLAVLREDLITALDDAGRQHELNGILTPSLVRVDRRGDLGEAYRA